MSSTLDSALGLRDDLLGPASGLVVVLLVAATRNVGRPPWRVVLLSGALLGAPLEASARDLGGALESNQVAAEATSQTPEPGAPRPSVVQSDQQQCHSDRRALAVLASLVPGVLFHGTGHYVHGCRRTGERLFWVSLAGLGLIATAFAPAIVFGANPYLVPLQVVVGVSGLVLFAGSWVFDVYGTSVPRHLRGVAMPPARLVTLFGYRYVYDPIFSYRHFLVQGFDASYRRLLVRPRAEFSLGAHNARYRLPVAYRVAGATPDDVGSGGSFLDVGAALTHHDFSPDGFSVGTLEVGVESRLDLDRYDAQLNGVFTEMGVGVGMNRYSYRAPGAGADLNSLLLVSFGFGAYFESPVLRGEAKLYYDHRHDDLAAGLKLRGLGSGVIGHFGAKSRAFFGDSWGIELDTQVGSAYIANVSLLYRQGLGDAL